MAKVKLVYNYIIKLLLVLIGSIDEKLRQNGNRMRNKKREQQQGNEKKKQRTRNGMQKAQTAHGPTTIQNRRGIEDVCIVSECTSSRLGFRVV